MEGLPVSIVVNAGKQLARINVGFDDIGLKTLRHINKSNVRFKGRGRSHEWKHVVAYEKAIKRAAAWQHQRDATEETGLVVTVDLRLGILISKSKAKLRGKSRAKMNDVDGVKAILDALNGVIWKDDRQIETLFVRLRAREEEEAIGDTIEITVYAADDRPHSKTFSPLDQ